MKIDAGLELAELKPGMTMAEATTLLDAWKLPFRAGEERVQTVRGHELRQSPIRLMAGDTPLGPLVDGYLLFDNGRLVRCSLTIAAPLAEARAGTWLGEPKLAWGAGRAWLLPATRTIVRVSGDGDTHKLDAMFFGIAIAEGELSESVWLEQQASFEEAVRDHGP